MNSYLGLARDLVPCAYELGWDDERQKLILRINEKVINGPLTWVNDHHLDVGPFKEYFGFVSSGFDLASKGPLGFEESFRYEGEEEGFLVYKAPIPQTKFNIGTCERCNGSGEDEHGMFCLSCDGEGQKSEIRYHGAQAFSATLGVITHRLNFPKRDEWIKSNRLQLMFLKVLTLDCASVSGEFSGPFVEFLGTLKSADLRSVEQAMIVAAEHMTGGPLPDYYDGCYEVCIEDRGYPWLRIDVPGSVTGIYGEVKISRNSHDGYEFQCHNVDHMFQQLPLIVALAKLHTMAREAGVGL